jgi:hypothetical protein
MADHVKAILDYATSGNLGNDFRTMGVPQKNIMLMTGLTEYPITFKEFQMKKAKPDAKFKMMFTGHISNLESPNKFNKNLNEFFSGKKQVVKKKWQLRGKR